MNESDTLRETPALYAIDEDFLRGRNRDLATLVEARLCPEARAQIGRVIEERAPASEVAGRVVFESRRTTVGDDLDSMMRLIADVCAPLPEFRSPRLPLAEMVFRILLTNQNRPMSADDLLTKLEEWVRPGDGRVITATVLERIIAADEFYGLRKVDEA